MATTKIPTSQTKSPRMRKERRTELVCVCGKRLDVWVPNEGWLPSLIAVALANRWKIEQHWEVEWRNEIDAYCPNCHDTH